MATPNFVGGTVLRYEEGEGTNDNDVVIQTGDVSAWDSFLLLSTAGAMDVLVSLDGTNYSTVALRLEDMGVAGSTPVLVTAAGQVYGFRGKFAAIRVLQNGATAVENATLVCANL